jgi:gamma-glutamyltranspeptidase
VATFTQDNVLIPVGAPWFRPSYADTLAAIAADPEAFYAGEIADRIVRAVQDRGGLMTGDDLKCT